MIKTLHGIRETVNFADGSSVMLYNNDEYEDYPNHWHSALEIIMPLENSYRAICGGISFKLDVEDILLIAPGTVHSLYAPQIGRRVILQVNYSVLSRLTEFDSIMSFMTPAICITPKSAPEIHNNIAKTMHAILNECCRSSILKEALIYSYLIQMVVLIGRRYTEQEKDLTTKNIKQQNYIEKFLFVSDYINQHFDENLTLDHVAAMAGFSKYYFTRIFKQFEGISFYKYLNKQRIMHAEQLLIAPELSVTEVATRSGFSSLSAFIRMFKLLKNCTPTEFRASCHSNDQPISQMMH
ncbi:MAG: helix-turn-helix domain-containing protein [Acetanaerobacterium sp.]